MGEESTKTGYKFHNQFICDLIMHGINKEENSQNFEILSVMARNIQLLSI